MNESRPSGPISPRQAVIAIAATLGLYLLVSFASKSLDAYRLRQRRDELAAEVTSLDQKRAGLEAERDRRQTTSWLEEALRDMGLLPPDEVGVVPVTATPGPATPTPAVQAAAVSAEPTPAVKLFANPNWRAWQRLIWGARY